MGGRPWPGRLTVEQLMYFVYILKSLKDGNNYVGLTSNTQNRLDYHNSGRVKSTKYRRPLILVYEESHATRQEAREREKYLKSYKGAKEKLSIIDSL